MSFIYRTVIVASRKDNGMHKNSSQSELFLTPAINGKSALIGKDR
jgi:hypothetical protein